MGIGREVNNVIEVLVKYFLNFYIKKKNIIVFLTVFILFYIFYKSNIKTFLV